MNEKDWKEIIDCDSCNNILTQHGRLLALSLHNRDLKMVEHMIKYHNANYMENFKADEISDIACVTCLSVLKDFYVWKNNLVHHTRMALDAHSTADHNDTYAKLLAVVSHDIGIYYTNIEYFKILIRWAHMRDSPGLRFELLTYFLMKFNCGYVSNELWNELVEYSVGQNANNRFDDIATAVKTNYVNHQYWKILAKWSDLRYHGWDN